MTEDVQAQYKTAQQQQYMPERRFEPELILETEFFELEKGDTLELSFDITDLHDYEFPLSFIDWNIAYSREPNPVAEGEAPDLPGTWNRTLFAEDYHVFRFSADDRQGFKARRPSLSASATYRRRRWRSCTPMTSRTLVATPVKGRPCRLRLRRQG